jgi:transcriptional regulator with XRE-family HTH domain/tetratricopeptide (TPR) repeat protein
MKAEPEDVQILVRMLRALRGWNQSQLAAAAGMDPSTIVRYENGRNSPPPASLERLLEAAGVPVAAAERLLLPVIRLLRRMDAPSNAPAMRGRRSGARSVRPELDPSALSEMLRDASGAVIGLIQSGMLARGIGEAGEALRGRKGFVPEPWVLAEQLCLESLRTAAHDGRAALEWAGFAVKAAEASEGSQAWRHRLRGFATGFRGNARRVVGTLRQADADFVMTWRLWSLGAGGDPQGLLPEWRLLDLEASLRRDQRRFPEALALLDRALAATPAPPPGRILLNRASILEQSGDARGAVAVLRQAETHLGDQGDLRDRFGVAFNLVVNLCHLGGFDEARSSLGTVRDLAGALGNDLDRLRVVWLSGRVAVGLDRREEARAAFEQVRDGFAECRNGVATAAVSLELAVLCLEEGQTAEVKELAEAMAWIFSSEGIERETLAALRLFCDAALRERATLAEARRLLGAFKQLPAPREATS